jgi:hypothetical protein
MLTAQTSTLRRGTARGIGCLVFVAVVYGCAAPAVTNAPAPSESAAAVASPSAESVPPSSAPAATESPQPTASPTRTPNPSPKELCASGDGVFPSKECKLHSGTYTSKPFKVPFQFSIDQGWTNSLAGINAGQLLKTATTGTGFGWATGMTAEGKPDVGKSTTAMLDFIATVPGITSSEPAAVTIGGVAGSSIDFSLSKGQIFFRVGKSGAIYAPGEKVRAYVLDVNGSVVMMAVEVYSPNDFEKEVAAVQPVIDSIVWE